MKRALLVILVGLLLAGGMSARAAAESGSLADPRGDAPARIDITRFSVANGEHRFTLRADIRDLRQKGDLTFNYWRGATGGQPMQSLLVAVDRVDGKTRARFYTCGFEDCARAACPRLRAAWRAGDDFVRVSAPQRCFPKPRTHPDARPPAAGRFFVWSELGDASDHLDDGPLALQRG